MPSHRPEMRPVSRSPVPVAESRLKVYFAASS
jgi:hypothetical protein